MPRTHREIPQARLDFLKALRPLVNRQPGVDLVALCPHMPENVRSTALKQYQTLVLPGTAIDGACWMLRLNDFKYTLRIYRTPRSYLHQNAAHNKFSDAWFPQPPAGLDTALAYGRETWGDFLKPDSAADALRIELHIPYWRQRPRIKIGYAQLRMSFQELSKSSVGLERAIAHFTTDPIEGLELAGTSPSRLQYCGTCKKQLWEKACTHWPGKSRFRKMPAMTLPPSIVSGFSKAECAFD